MRQSRLIFRMELSNEKILSFIEDYRKSELLWDIRRADYKDNKKKNEQIQELANKYESTVELIKRKIKNLRCAFHREHKALIMKNSGLNPKKKAKWFAYEALTFLLEVELSKRGNSTEENNSSEDESNEFIVTPTILNDDQTLDTDVKFDATINESVSSFKTPTQQPHKKRKLDVNLKQSITEEAYAVLKESTKKDEHSTYGEYVANEIRKLQPTAQTIVKHLINNILFDAAMGKYNTPSFLEGVHLHSSLQNYSGSSPSNSN